MDSELEPAVAESKREGNNEAVVTVPESEQQCEDDDEAVQESDSVRYVLDSLATDTEVTDSQFAMAVAESDNSHVAAGGMVMGALHAEDDMHETVHTLLHLASIKEFKY
ncbi:hypothetical protein ABZP36_005288 [Zizania latifolia]